VDAGSSNVVFKYEVAMTLLVRLLAFALALPPPYYLPGREPETKAERAARIERIVAAAIAESNAVDKDEWPGTTEDLAAALLAVTFYESRHWALEVHDGRARGDRGKSVCLAQIWTQDRSLAGTSSEATHRCMRRAVEIMVLHSRRCGFRYMDQWQAARLFGAYGTGRTCRATHWSKQRASLWARIRRAAEAPPREDQARL
jgi:hypothetical protein